MFVNVLKFVLGFLLAIAILAGGSLVAALYVINRVSTPPAKPTFANDSPSVRGEAPKSTSAKPQPKMTSNPTPSASPKTAESPKPLPPGAYPARVTWSQGLVLRSEPKVDAERVGGVGFRQKIIVLEQSQDKAWQKIRVENGNKEGWVKAGNTKPADINDSQSPQQSQPTEQQQ